MAEMKIRDTMNKICSSDWTACKQKRSLEAKV